MKIRMKFEGTPLTATLDDTGTTTEVASLLPRTVETERIGE